MSKLWVAMCNDSTDLLDCFNDNPWFALCVLILGIVLILLLAVVFYHRSDKKGELGAAFVLAGPLVPMIASLAIIIFYVILTHDGQPELHDALGAFAVLLGTSIAIVIWVIAAWLLRSFTSPEMANQDSYNLLVEYLTILDARLAAHCSGELKSPKKGYCDQARSLSDNIKKDLGLTKPDDALKGSSWVSAAGYSHAWENLHRAEEALVEVEPIEDIIREALHNELSLTGSAVRNSAALLNKLRVAIAVLWCSALKYLIPKTAADVQELLRAFSVPNNALDLTQKPCPDVTLTSAPQGEIHNTEDETPEIRLARAVLHEVCRDLNVFRDRAWEGLVRSRNHLLVSVTFTGILVYIIIMITTIVGSNPNVLLSATVFFLIGALIGLFAWLQHEAKMGRNNDDDYGLSRALLIHTPLVSGLAAVGGVILYAIAPSLLIGTSPTPGSGASATPTVSITRTITPTATTPIAVPTLAITPTAPILNDFRSEANLLAQFSTPTPTNSAGAINRSLPSLEDIFNLDGNLFSLIVAAAFGLAPNLLISSLQKQTDQYKRDIKSIEAPEGTDNSDILS
ncbi:MAG: hypothetical protein WCD37_09610 [Chloroflexia bacterium]